MKINGIPIPNQYPFLSISLFLFMTSNVAAGLPKYSKESPVNDFQAHAISVEPLLKGAQILADDKTNTLYISPSSKKSQGGEFQAVATPACQTLKAHYDLTYLMPDVPKKQYVEFAKKGPYSPFFDAKLGNYVRQTSILNLISTKREEIQKIKSTHKVVVEAYEKAKAKFEIAQNEYQAAEASLEALSKRIDLLSERLLHADDAEERAVIQQQIDSAKLEKKNESPRLKERIKVTRKIFHDASLPYLDAKVAYHATVPSVEAIEGEITSLTAMFDTINKLSINQYLANEAALQAFESVAVGTATASYSIWGEEESRLRNVLAVYQQRIPYFKNHAVTRLPIHNIRLKKPQYMTTRGAVSGTMMENTSISTARVGIREDSLMVSDNAHLTSLSMFSKANHSVSPEIQTLSDDGAATYVNIVTRGAYCTGNSPKRHSEKIELSIKDENHNSTFNFDVFVFKPRTTNVLAQSVALEYDFYVRSEPTGVTCTLDINKFRHFFSDTGTSGVLFWRKTWSEVELRRAEQSGISCNVTLSPSGENPYLGEEAKRVAAIRQTMIQEIAAEFILTYAKSWDVSKRQGSIANNRDALTTAGVALETLCGTNIYCAIAGIVLKTGDELFGSQSDRVVNRDYLSGTISRSYDETSWTLSNGQAIIDLSVSI